METNKLRYFTVVAQTENLRKAAEILHVSPSAISKVLTQLSDELGMELVTPLGRGITLTDAGKKLAEESTRLLGEFDQLKERLISANARKRIAPVRIATFEVFSTYFLEALNRTKWETRGLVLHEVLPGELEKAVEQRLVDVGITYMPMPYKDLEFVKISSIEMGVYKRKGTFKGIRQQDLPFVAPVMPLHGAPTRIRGLDGWPEDAYDRKVLFEVTLMESALELCRQGRCAGYFPCFVAEQHNEKYRSDFELERHPSPTPSRKCFSDVYLVYRKDRGEDETVRLAAKLVRAGCKAQ